MSFSERDFIRRIIEDFARLVAGIVALRQGGKLDEAEREIVEAARGLLGPLARDAELLDSQALSRFFSEEKLVRYASLIAERANVRQAKGDAQGARDDRLRALELFLEHRAKHPAPRPELSAETVALLDLVGLAALGERYRAFVSGSSRGPA
jgi:hypothetical protein